MQFLAATEGVGPIGCGGGVGAQVRRASVDEHGVEGLTATGSELAQVALRSDLLGALERNEFEVHYQPIVELRDERVIGFEALLRWNHPEIGMIPAAVFIPVAEESDVISRLGDWVLAEACRQLAEWDREFEMSLSMAVNVSPIQLLDDAFIGNCLRIVAAAGLNTEQIWLEVTESAQVGVQLRQLREQGLRVALGDVGATHTDLDNVTRMPVEQLKIGRSFVAGLVVPSDEMRVTPQFSSAGQSTVRQVLAIAEAAGMSVVAEGIETEEQRRVLLDLGCLRGQGFLFARPMPARAASCLLAEADRLLVEAAEAAVGRESFLP